MYVESVSLTDTHPVPNPTKPPTPAGCWQGQLAFFRLLLAVLTAQRETPTGKTQEPDHPTPSRAPEEPQHTNIMHRL